MPRDKRLYMTLPIDFDEHPKILPLTDAAFRAFISMNLYSRRNNLDGVIPGVAARLKWKPRPLAELVDSHPDRPLITFVDDVYVIRDYAEHQETSEVIERRRQTNMANGVRGGRPKKNPNETGSVFSENPNETEPKAEIEIEKEKTTSKDVVPRKRGTRVPDPFIVNGEMRLWASDNTPTVNVDLATKKFVNYWRAKTRDATKLDWFATWQNWLMSDAERQPTTKPTPTERAQRTVMLATELMEVEA